MRTVVINLQTKEGSDSLPLTIGENATIAELLRAIQDAGVDVGEFDDQVAFLVDDKECVCQKSQRLHECGIGHGTKLHFRDREVVIIVNTRRKKWTKKEISFKEVVELAFGNYQDDPNIVYTVTYAKGPAHKREGSMVKGQSVKVKEGMIFNVTQTDKS